MLKVVFLGTPEFAAPCLRGLVEAGHRICLVVTQPDRPKGRGRKTVAPPVKTAADEMGLPLFQPVAIRSDDAIARIAGQSPDVLVVAAFGQLLPEPLLTVAPGGAVNVHASLLPRFRGPAPIQWAVIRRETETGITTMQMDTGIDTGDILLTAATAIQRTDTAGTLHDRLKDMAPALLIRTLEAMEKGRLKPRPQDDSLATYAPLLRKGDGLIDWRQSAGDIEAFVRGMNPWPGAFTRHEGKRLKIFAARPEPDEPSAPPGTVVEVSEAAIRVATGKGTLAVLELQAASGKRQATETFVRGYRLPENEKFH
ncbi:MAG: methionyl-tRNA formyltransferase [Desulfobacteraceae bacterium]|nr:methionyl-tRNA formyltransferase [Desulfobacteraceae bacterium]